MVSETCVCCSHGLCSLTGAVAGLSPVAGPARPCGVVFFWHVPGSGQGGIHCFTSSMTEEGFPWWNCRLGAGAGRGPAGLFSPPRSPPCCGQEMLHFPGNGSWGGWSQLRGAHTWGAHTVSTPGASWHTHPRRLPAAGTNRDELPPGSVGQGNEWVGGVNGEQFVSPSRWAPSSHTDCHARGETGVSQPGSGLLRKKEHVAAWELVSGSV